MAPHMGAIWAQDASKPSPAALQDRSKSAKEPCGAAKWPPRAPRDRPGVDFDFPRDRLGVHFDPPEGPGDFQNCIQAMIPPKRLHLPFHSTNAGSAGPAVAYTI